MSNTKFTPGPWSYICDDSESPTNFKGYIQGDTGYTNACIAHVWPDRETPTGQANAEANARLIAAAPEMYEALQYALVDLKESGGRVSKIEAVLAKVKGD